MKDSTRARIWGWFFFALAAAAYLTGSEPAYTAMVAVIGAVVHASADVMKALGK